LLGIRFKGTVKVILEVDGTVYLITNIWLTSAKMQAFAMRVHLKTFTCI